MNEEEILMKILIALIIVTLVISGLYLYTKATMEGPVEVALYECDFGRGVYYVTNYTIGRIKVTVYLPPTVAIVKKVKGYNETYPHYIITSLSALRRGDPFHLVVLDKCSFKTIEIPAWVKNKKNLTEVARRIGPRDGYMVRVIDRGAFNEFAVYPNTVKWPMVIVYSDASLDPRPDPLIMLIEHTDTSPKGRTVENSGA